MRTLRSAFTRFLLLALLLVVHPAIAEDIDRSFELGTSALKAGKYDEALRAFETVWKQRRTHDVAANMALAEMQLGRHRDAAGHLAFALRSFPVTGDSAVKKAIDAAFAQAKAHVMTLRVTVNVEGAEVRVDGTPIGRSPITDEIFVEPGSRSLEARLAHHVAATKTVQATKGGTGSVDLVLTPEPQATATASATATVPPPPPPRSMVPAYVVGGVGVASLIAGGVLVGVAEGKSADVRSKMPRDANGEPLCGQSAPTGAPPGSICDELRATAGDVAVLGNGGIALFAIGGAAVAGALTYWLWPVGPAPSGKPSSMLVPIIATNGGGLQWTGSF